MYVFCRSASPVYFLMLTIMSCFAQAESESISKNVAWGIRQSFKNGNVPMQYARLLGYKKGENGLPEIIPEEAEIVREIFRQYLDGSSMEQIAVSCESRQGFCKNHVNFPLSAEPNHFQKFGTLLRLSSGDAFVYVPTDFDTIEKAFSRVKTAEKGICTFFLLFTAARLTSVM